MFSQGKGRESYVSPFVYHLYILNFPIFIKIWKTTINVSSLIVLLKSTIVLGKRLVIRNEKASAAPDKVLQKRLWLFRP